MAVASYVDTADDNATLDQASVFLAGGFGDHYGGLFCYAFKTTCELRVSLMRIFDVCAGLKLPRAPSGS